MTEQLLQCVCSHMFRFTDADVGKSGRCPRCNRNAELQLINGDVFLCPIKVGEGNVLPVFGNTDTSTYSIHSRPYNQPAYQNNTAALYGEAAEIDGNVLVSPARPGECCARCRKPFRGDWDKTDTPNGCYCHSCSILAVESVDELQKAKEDSELKTLEVIPHHLLNTEEESSQLSDESATGNSIWAKIIFIFVTLALFICLIVFPVEKVIPELVKPYTAEDILDAPESVKKAVMLIPYGVHAIAIFIWVYFGIALTDYVPNLRRRDNAIVAGVFTIGILIFLGPWFLLGIIAGPFTSLVLLMNIGFAISIISDISFYDFMILSITGAIATFLSYVIGFMLQGLYLGLVL